MNIIKTIDALRAFREPLWPAGKTLSYVPTMGALHAGHLELMQVGMAQSDICLPYIFLNPKQFAQGEDLDAYPKTLDQDLEKMGWEKKIFSNLKSLNGWCRIWISL